MKKHGICQLLFMLCFMIGILLLPISKINAHANSVVVSGTIQSGTTSDMMYLSTSSGTMHIKLDSTTDANGCKLLLPGTSVVVTVTRGSDAYMHALKITVPVTNAPVTVDKANAVTVTGTISEKSKNNLLYVNTSSGEMQIKLDSDTNLSGCSVLVVNKNYNFSCARGSDAYMHAVSISDAATVSSQAAAGPIVSTNGNPNAVVVMGTVDKNTTDSILHLATSSGTMLIKIDNTTETSRGMVLVPGRTLSVAVYRGNDAYMHASAIAGVKSASTAVVDTSSSATVTGTVSSKSTEDILFLNTSGGEMQLKLDNVKSMTNCKVLTSGKTITVTCSRGSDAYMHAITISGNASSAASSSAAVLTAPTNGNSSAVVVVGTVTADTKNNLLHLNTSSGVMKIVIDAATDTSKGMVHTPGNTLAVSVYRGNDAYMHAIAVVGVKDTSSNITLSTDVTAVAGFVGEKSNENILYLNTSQGEMQLKLDTVKNVNCKSLTKDKIVVLTCARGSDAYMHAIDLYGF